jgi:hypothetical protein
MGSTPALRPTMLQATKRGASCVAQCPHNTKLNIQCYVYTKSATHFLHTHTATYLPFPVCQYRLFVGDTEACVCVCVCVCVLAGLLKMVSQTQEVVVKYMEPVQQKRYVPRFSYGRGLLRDDGVPNRLFFTYLLGDDALAISFLQDAKQTRSQVLCTHLPFLLHGLWLE